MILKVTRQGMKQPCEMQKRQFGWMISEFIARFRQFTTKNMVIRQGPAQEPPGNSGPEKIRACG